MADAEDLDIAIGTVRGWLDSMAAGAPAEFGGLLAYVLDGCALRGNAVDYANPRNSMLHAMVRERLGIPITISLVIALVGARVGVRVDMLGLPGHVMVRCGDGWADPFSGSELMTGRQALRRWGRIGGAAATDLRGHHLRGMTPRGIVVRMLNNLTHEFVRRDDRYAMDTAVRLRQNFHELSAESSRWDAWQSAWN